MDAESVARTLYRNAPSAFVAARKAAANQAKETDDKTVVGTISAMRKPSVAAWAINQLANREHGDGLAIVPELHAEFSAAQAAGDGKALRDLDARRRELVSEATRDARAIADEEGVALSAAALTELEQTLRAGVADRAAAAAVTSGVLVHGLSANGYDPVDIDDAVAVPIAVPAGRGAAPAGRVARSAYRDQAHGGRAEPAKRSQADRRAADRALRQAERAVLDAEQAADDAEDEREEASATAEALQRRLEDLRAEGDELVEQLARIRDDTADTKRSLNAAIRSRSEAERAARRAATALETAKAARQRLR